MYPTCLVDLSLDICHDICNAIAPYRRSYGYITLAYQHAISAGMCPELIFPYIPYLSAYGPITCEYALARPKESRYAPLGVRPGRLR